MSVSFEEINEQMHAAAARDRTRRDMDRMRGEIGDLKRQLSESFASWDNYALPIQTLLNGPWAINPYSGLGASGSIIDRQAGRDAPLFWTEVQLRQYRWMSRVLCQSNIFAIGFMGRLTDYHIRKGVAWQVCLQGATKTPYYLGEQNADPAVKRAQAILDRWRNGDPSNPKSSWPIRSRELFMRWRRDGEIFVRLFMGDREQLPEIRILEPEQVGSPDGDDTSARTSFGMLNAPDDIFTTQAVFVRDPWADGTKGQWVTTHREIARDELPVDAIPGDIIHLTANVDSSVKRGLPDFFPLQDELDQVRRLLKNMATVSSLQAAIAWIEQYSTASPGQIQGLIQQNQDYTRPKVTSPWGSTQQTSVTQYEAGSKLLVDAQRQYVPAPNAVGVPGFIAVEQAVLRAGGARWGMPEYFSGDASNNAFASALVSGSPFAVAVEGAQMEWCAFERAVALRVLYLAAAAGLLSWEDFRRLDVECTPPGVVSPKPGEDSARRIQLIGAKVMSVQTAQMQEGLDPAHEAANMRAWEEQHPDQSGGGMADLMGGGGFGESRQRKRAHRRLREEHGAPPRPGLVWKSSTHRWIHPDTGDEYHRDGTQTHGDKARHWLEDSNLPPELAAKYEKTAKAAIDRLPTGCAKKMYSAIDAGSVVFHPTIASLREECGKIGGKPAKDVVGFAHESFSKELGRRGTHMHLDDDSDSLGTYLHEMGHAIDLGQIYSDDKKWQSVWKSEIFNGRNLLSRYARTDPSEGFAELIRKVGVDGVERTEKQWPKSCAFLRAKGLI